MDQPPADAAQQNAATAARKAQLQLLGMAVRAGRVALGSDAALLAVSRGQAALLLLATDVGDNAGKKFRDKCSTYQIPLAVRFNRAELGHACGRAQVVAAAVTDPGFAAKLAHDAGEISGGVLFDKTSRV